MKIYINKLYIILGIIPIVVIMIIIILNNNNSSSSPTNSDIKICGLEENSCLYYSNNSEFIKLYSNLVGINNSIILDKDKNFSIFKIQNLNYTAPIISQNLTLQSGQSLVINFQKNNQNNYKAKLLIYHKTQEKIISFKFLYFNVSLDDFKITCFEQERNHIFCIYITEIYPHNYITKLNITHFYFNGTKLIQKSDHFLYAFNYKIKSIQSQLISERNISLVIYKENKEIEIYLINNFLKKKINVSKCINYESLNNTKFNKIGKRKAFMVFEKNKTYIEGHRGGSNIYHENTIQNFIEAIENGLDSIELDVWLTKDNIPIVRHDSLLDIIEIKNGDNITKEKLRVNNVSYSYIQERNKKKNFKGKEIPTLEEVLDICKNKIFINIELKDYQIELTFNIVINLITKKNMFDQISLSSFKYPYFSLINRYNKYNNIKIECGYIFQLKSKIKDITNTTGCVANVRVTKINEEMVQKAHRHGIPISTFFLKKDQENETIYKTLLDLGVDIICCNYPKNAKKFRDEYYKNKAQKYQCQLE